MKVQTCFVVASMFAGALTAPLQKRDTVVQTEYVNVVEVVSLTSTLYVNAGETPAAEQNFVQSTPTAAPAVPTTTPIKKHSYTRTVKQPSSSKVALPTSETKKEEPTTISTPTTTSTPPPTTTAEPTATTTPEVKTPTTTSAPAAPTSSQAATPNSGTGGTKSGEATFYSTGLGSCGIQNASSDMVVAISKTLMDAATVGGNTNGNPLCGKKIKCTRGGKSVEVTVTDRCEGCAMNDLDFSEAAFQKLATVDEGRVNIEWEWL